MKQKYSCIQKTKEFSFYGLHYMAVKCVAVLPRQLARASPRLQRAYVLQCQLSSNSMLQKVGVIKRFY